MGHGNLPCGMQEPEELVASPVNCSLGFIKHRSSGVNLCGARCSITSR